MSLWRRHPKGFLLTVLLAGSAAFAPAAESADGTCADVGPVAAAPQAIIGASAAPASWSAAAPQAAVSSTTSSGPVSITLRPGAQPFPGVALVPGAGKWNLSTYGGVVARLTNNGSQVVTAGLRLDDSNTAGNGKWNDASMKLAPGETGTLTLDFGHSQGKAVPSIDRASVARAIVFAAVSGNPVDLRLDSLAAAGSPVPDAAAPRRTRPVGGLILGDGNCVDRAALAIGNANTRADLTGSTSSRHLQLKGRGDEAGVVLLPVTGYWDLRDYLQVTAKIHNSGSASATVSGRIESAEGNTGWSAAVTVPAGGTSTLTMPFAAASSVDLTDVAPAKYASDVTSAIVLKVSGAGDQAISVDEMRAGMPVASKLPDWVGHRPPVPGDWKMTLDENFDGSAIDPARWASTGTNYWDKVSHFSKQNLVVADGQATLRFEHRRGHANDDPAQAETDYTTGFLTSVGKWTQRYGYFEARLKLPKAPGLWPAFWLMPDRGASVPNAVDRLSTSNGGMEFDILEYLTRFGPNRYNVALHWDGYAEHHKTTNDDGTYVQPDADGYIVAGLLWEPGSVAFYANGREVAHRSDARIGSVPAYVLFTLVSGGWGGNDLTGAGLPDGMSIDWVRAWQRAGR